MKIFESKFYVTINDGMTSGTHYVSCSWGGTAWSGTPSMTDEELKKVADTIYEYLNKK